MLKAMVAHSSTLAWKTPWTEKPGGLWSMGSRRVRHDWVTSLSLFTFMHWRRKWQPTPVFLPGESQGWGSLVGRRLWGPTESDTTEVTYLTLSYLTLGSAGLWNSYISEFTVFLKFWKLSDIMSKQTIEQNQTKFKFLLSFLLRTSITHI